MNRSNQKTLLNTRHRLINEFRNHISTTQSLNSSTNARMVKYRFQALCETYMRFRDNYIEIEISGVFDVNAMHQMQNENFQIENDYFNCKANLCDLVPDMDETQPEIQPHHSTMNYQTALNESQYAARNSSKLPPIAVKKFSGKVEDWEEFSDLFTSLIMENPAITDVHKMHYLKCSLEDEPAKIIKHLPATAQSLPAAWFLLTQTYLNRRSIIEANLTNFFALKPLKENDHHGLREFIVVTNNMLSALGLQGINTLSWDPILVYVLTEKMNSDTLHHWENSLTDNKEMPTLRRLFNFLETRIQVEQRTSSRKEGLNSSLGMSRDGSPTNICSPDKQPAGLQSSTPNAHSNDGSDQTTSVSFATHTFHKCYICEQKHAT